MIRPLAALAAFFPAGAAFAHGFDERHDLPAPLYYFVTGAAATVALSFVVAAVFARRAPSVPDDDEGHGRSFTLGPLLPILRRACQVVGVGLFVITVVAALWGTGDPMMNIAPTLVWVVWWVGLSLAVACLGNFWPALDPWRALFEVADAAARRLGRARGIKFGWRWPSAWTHG